MNNQEKRGDNNPLQQAYADTVADYTSGSTPPGDNVIENLTCDASVAVGSIVRINGSTIVRALANNLANSRVLGICISKSNATTCNVQVCGFTPNIFAGLSTTNSYYLSDSTLGGLTTTPPTTSGSYVIRIGETLSGNNMIIHIERVVKRA